MDYLTFDNLRHAAHLGDALAWAGLDSWGDVLKTLVAVLIGAGVTWKAYRRVRPAAPPSVVVAHVLAALEGESIWVRRMPKASPGAPVEPREGAPVKPRGGLDGDLLAANLVIAFVDDRMTEVKAGCHDCLPHLTPGGWFAGGDVGRVRKKARAVVLAHEKAERKAQEAATAAAVLLATPRTAGVLVGGMPRLSQEQARAILEGAGAALQAATKNDNACAGKGKP